MDGHQGEVYSLDIIRDGRLLASGSGDATLIVWGLNNSFLPSLAEEAEGVTTESTVGFAEIIRIIRVNDQHSYWNDSGITSVAFSPNGSIVAAGSLDGVVRLWNVGTGEIVKRLVGHKDSVHSIAFTPDGNGLISGSLDKSMKYWSYPGQKMEHTSKTSTLGHFEDTDYINTEKGFTGHTVKKF